MKPNVSLIEAWYYLDTLSFVDKQISAMQKALTYSFEPQIDIRLNQYLKDIISHLLHDILER